MLNILLSIFVIQIVYVSCFTLRMILTLKGKKYFAAAISIIEITIYVLGLNMVLQYLKQPLSLLVYALGYGLGVLAGTWIEEKLALGYVTLKVITNEVGSNMASDLRQQGYGVTSWIGYGRDGERLVLEVLAKRKNEHSLYKSILAIDPRAFVVTLEPKQLHGGFWTRTNRK
ncbi:DUF2179 domain-containing protein [Paenibacillus allorhizosphaerae]|uniref:UPF0316 protein PAECIP111802_06604 n=1 Tax=Paenibacillus allorhizosphaerae TaxID=2849866 RepID=A0ABN7TZJ7_9BACL|nr:DUF2179 domain-containing protein [Paenibacillus allorhizosphaerae]CAG7657069.1 hypothetical protein PAECIP111802_06604 [Paenibacillus allorhizosphaerae]